MKKAFTLLELLVATMLLAMLVTILTMIFNQSSIAWTIGVASLTGMGDIRKNDAIYAAESENLVFGGQNDDTPLRVVSVWNEDGSGLRTDGRTIESGFKLLNATRSDVRDPLQGQTLPLGSGSAGSRASYIVGVTSWGPDGLQGTWDDITSMPEEVVR